MDRNLYAGYCALAEKRADSSLVSCLGAFFLGADPYVYFYLSNGNNAISLKALNGGQAVIKPTKGAGDVRDPSIVQGGGTEAGGKWYIVGTDLNIGKTTWDAAQRTGSRGIFLWEIEDATAGTGWAHEAIWDFIGSDFKTFTSPQTYIDKIPIDAIDLDILPLDSASNNYLRFLKDETVKTAFLEYSTSGLFGPWARAGGSSRIITSGVEGPAAYRDNQVDANVHVLLGFYGSDG
ncbi:putative Glycoside hydrolase family 43 protein [Seiridium unicorne]|uniref:Glycoside hydrolase family 43 protein n=1 Tax=Seiridium unicorne TaxID=138068 RepID=A0ABR2UKX0_9PEZI